MSHRNFADLDELVLRCHDDKARAYIAEAMVSYKAGALRAAILSTWIAVAFDFIDKIRQLELQGDAVAVAIAAELTTIHAQNDVVRSLAFERNILGRALNDLGFISASEHHDLSRLYEDRHRCAHPSMNAKGEIFQPTAEQVRYHIRTAVDAMLSQPPTSGKAALTTLMSQVEGSYFPTETEKALIVLKSSPIAKPRPSLVRNLVIVLLKRMLEIGIDKAARLRAAAALNAIKRMHPEACSMTISEKLNPLLRSITDENFGPVIALVARLEDGDNYVDSDIKTRMEQYVSITDPASLSRVAEVAASFKLVRLALHNRLSTLSSLDFITVIERAPSLLYTEEVRGRAPGIYCSSGSFDQANDIATKLIIPLAQFFSREQIESVLTGSFENNQILGSFQFAGAMVALRSNPSVERGWWNKLLAGLDSSGQFSQLSLEEQTSPAVQVTENDEPPF